MRDLRLGLAVRYQDGQPFDPPQSRPGRSRPACYPAAGGRPPLDFARVAEIVVSYLAPHGLPVAVVGAFGLQAHGLPRATVDLDFVTDRAAQAGLVEHLEGVGYETLHVSPGYSNHLHADPVLGRVDFVYVTGETSRLLFAGCREMIDLGRRRLPVPRAEHLAAMKIQAIKNDPARALRDLADISFLVQRPGVDRDEVRRYFEKAGLQEKWDELARTL